MFTEVPVRFDADQHRYTALDTGLMAPSITQMLHRAGLIDDQWFTEESCARGTRVHTLTADYDTDAITDLASVTSAYKPYLLAHVNIVSKLRPQGLEMLEVEQVRIHPTWRFGGRPDRVVRFYGLGVWEVKSGGIEKSHQIQTALQAILSAAAYDLPPEAWKRYAEYLKPTGKGHLEEHTNRRDFDVAYDIIKRFAA